MKAESESVKAQKDTRTARDDIRSNNLHRRTIYDTQLRRALVEHARPTR
jgi:hypothetical protein